MIALNILKRQCNTAASMSLPVFIYYSFKEGGHKAQFIFCDSSIGRLYLSIFTFDKCRNWVAACWDVGGGPVMNDR